MVRTAVAAPEHDRTTVIHVRDARPGDAYVGRDGPAARQTKPCHADVLVELLDRHTDAELREMADRA